MTGQMTSTVGLDFGTGQTCSKPAPLLPSHGTLREGLSEFLSLLSFLVNKMGIIAD